MTDFRYPVSISHRDQAQVYLIQGIDIQPTARDYDRRPWVMVPSCLPLKRSCTPVMMGSPPEGLTNFILVIVILSCWIIFTTEDTEVIIMYE